MANEDLEKFVKACNSGKMSFKRFTIDNFENMTTVQSVCSSNSQQTIQTGDAGIDDDNDGAPSAVDCTSEKDHSIVDLTDDQDDVNDHDSGDDPRHNDNDDSANVKPPDTKNENGEKTVHISHEATKSTRRRKRKE
eukprot:scaffold355535_cov66-Cyclotella_meneghiniana.AAC.1